MIEYFFQNSKEYKEIVKSVKQKISPIYIDGINDSVLNIVMSKIGKDLERPIFIFTDSDKKARDLFEECNNISDNCIYIPSKEIVFFDTFSHTKNNEIERIEKIITMMEKPKIVFSSIENLLIKYPKKDLIDKYTLEFGSEDTIAVEELNYSLFNMGYERVEFTETKGQYSIRGGIIDIFSPLCDNPYRIELFDDEIDSIRTFNLATQKSIENIRKKIKIYPAREVIFDFENIEDIIVNIDKIDSNNLNESTKGNFEVFKSSLKEKKYFDGAYKYFPLLNEDCDTLIDYCKDPICVFLQSATLMNSIKLIHESFLRKISDYFEKGYLLSKQSEIYFSEDETIDNLMDRQMIICDYLIKNLEGFKIEQIFKLNIREVSNYFGNIESLSSDIKRWTHGGNKVVISVGDKKRIDKIKEELNDFGVPSINAENLSQQSSGILTLGDMGISAGFQINTFKLIVLTEKEIYNVKKKKKKKANSQGQFIKSYTDLKLGDRVVHENHGVGIYRGISRLKVENTQKDYMRITYSGEDVLYIPVENSDIIQKYIGSDSDKVKVSKLGGVEWKKTKLRAKKTIEDMTDELLALYAERQKKKGFAFSADGEWQKDFEGMFPYQETKDQLKCIAEIKADMELAKPMERLLCGDVGYGKTEVAIRAAFKAITDSKQVAILVPTTILAQQHYTNLVSRFSKYPATIEMMSRFRTKKQQEEIAERVSKGLVDIVVGTHRILSNDVKYKDLGLLIIDEEQRFGVKHKEKIKMLKENVDVLTLTATPIPRTLHMSLIGIRHMSLIEDPPEDRYPIQTYVMQEDDYTIQECIQRELDRNGQVYFVHNRVKDIDQVAAKIQKLNPDADVRFAHGQMGEKKLENMMMAFLNHEFDVLVSTTIIETGLDISNVNTIIINNGDKLGLSQLYQLRGRVGRSNRLAYCYILYKRDKVLSEVAEKRLTAIKELTELGSGFKIAMRDLEIRGTGNVLGSQQHGQMEAIGYDLYCKLLDESIRSRKGETIEVKPESKIEFKIDAYIPEKYILNDNAKIDIYKKIAVIKTRDDLMELQDELEDRFGKIPRALNNLISVSYIRNMIEDMGFETMYEVNNRIVFKFGENIKIHPKFISDVLSIKEYKSEFKSGKESLLTLRITGILRNKEEMLKKIELFVETIYSFL